MVYIYIVTCILFVILGITITKRLVNPLTLFNFIWGGIVFLYQLRLSRLQMYLDNNTYVLFLQNILSFSITFIIFFIIKFKNNDIINETSNKEIKKNTLNKLFKFWLIVELIEIIISRGIPFIWLIMGHSKTYMDFGIPTVHGLMNSVGLIIILLSWNFYLTDKEKNKKFIYIVLFILLYYLLLISRQVLISAIIEMISLYLFNCKKVPWKKIALLSIIVILSFGLIGNFRTGYDSFLSVSALKNTNINKSLIGIYWVYMYLTMTVSNINNAVVNHVVNYGFYPIIHNFLPTVISNVLFKNGDRIIPNIYVTPAFNVSGYFREFYIGFGNLGVICISAIYGLLGAIFMKKIIKNRNTKNKIYYSIYLQIILLSFFSNHLLYLPSGFQFIIVMAIYKYIKVGGNKI